MTDQAPHNKKHLASQQMREKILRTTIEIIGSDGYVALTASHLSQRAGISKGALYHHFNSLDEVKISALAFLLSLIETEEPKHVADFRDYLNAYGKGVFRRMKQQPVEMKALYAYIIQAFVDEALIVQVRELISQTLAAYTEVVRGYFPGLSETQLNQAVLILDAQFAGVILQWFLLDDESTSLAGWEQFSDMLYCRLRAMEKS